MNDIDLAAASLALVALSRSIALGSSTSLYSGAAGFFAAGLAAFAAGAGACGGRRRSARRPSPPCQPGDEREPSPELPRIHHRKLHPPRRAMSRRQGIIPHSNILLTMGAETLLKNAWRICGSLLAAP